MKGVIAMNTLCLHNLTEFREQRLMSRAELARKAEISPLTILKIEKGEKCRPETARKIILGLGYTLDDRDYILHDVLGPVKALENEEEAAKANDTLAQKSRKRA
jgi:DNA-binding XRE family transcriptional regulator